MSGGMFGVACFTELQKPAGSEILCCATTNIVHPPGGDHAATFPIHYAHQTCSLRRCSSRRRQPLVRMSGILDKALPVTSRTNCAWVRTLSGDKVLWSSSYSTRRLRRV